jgi:hypothetical protein
VLRRIHVVGLRRALPGLEGNAAKQVLRGSGVAVALVSRSNASSGPHAPGDGGSKGPVACRAAQRIVGQVDIERPAARQNAERGPRIRRVSTFPQKGRQLRRWSRHDRDAPITVRQHGPTVPLGRLQRVVDMDAIGAKSVRMQRPFSTLTTQ